MASAAKAVSVLIIGLTYADALLGQIVAEVAERAGSRASSNDGFDFVTHDAKRSVQTHNNVVIPNLTASAISCQFLSPKH